MNKILSLAAVAVLGFGWMQAEVVENYSVDFNTEINTTDHAFKIGTAWGHEVKSYSSYYDESETFVTYTWAETEGVDGTGALKVGTQQLGWSGWVNDMLVTPELTGTLTLKIKSTSTYSGSSTGIRMYAVTPAGGTAFTKGEMLAEKVNSEDMQGEWYTVTIENLNGTRVGIIASQLLLDDLVVTGSANIEPAKILALSNLVNDGTDHDCDADGNFTFTYTVTITNEGEVALDNTMEGYSLSVGGVSYVNGKGYVIDDEKIVTTVPIEATSIAVGESYTQTIVVNGNINNAPFNNGRVRMDVRENISKSSITGVWIEPIPYVAELSFRNENGNDLSYSSYASDFGAFGMFNHAVSKTMVIRNDGAAPAEVTIAVPEGFGVEPASGTVAAHSALNVVVTLLDAAPGTFAGDLTVTSDALTEPFTLALSGTMLDNNIFYEGFEENKTVTDLPAGWYAPTGNWSKTSNTNGSNNYATAALVNANKLITPLLRVADGQTMTFEAARKSSSSFVNVYYSADRDEWTLALELTNEQLTAGFQTFELANVPAGDYYIAFEAGYSSIDNVYGFAPVAVERDLVFTASSLPTNAMVNNDYAASVTVKNLLGEAEDADYAVNLLFNNEVVATAEPVVIDGCASATFDLAFVPTVAGEFPAQIQLVCGDYVVATDVVTVTVTEEIAGGLVQVGENDATNSSAPLSLMYANSETDVLYTAEQLGINAGNKIAAITYKGYFTSTTDLTKIVSVWVQNTDVESIALDNNVGPFSTEDMTLVYSAEVTFTANGSSSNHVDLLVVPFDEPFEYTGGNLRVIVRADALNENDNSWVSSSYYGFEVDNDITGQCLYHRNDSYDTFNNGTSSYSTLSYIPVAYMTVVAEPAVITGYVKDVEGEPLEGVAITAKSIVDAGEGAPMRAATAGPVVYPATTDANGYYELTINQTDKHYDITYSLDGYDDVTFEDVDPAQPNVTRTVTLNATKYAIFVADAENGVVSVDVTEAAAEEEVYVTAVPAEGYTVESVKVNTLDGEEICEAVPSATAANRYSFYMPSQAVRIVVTFTKTTGVTDLKAGISSVKYYNVSGVESDKPFDGVNIVVTRHADGSVKTTKVIF